MSITARDAASGPPPSPMITSTLMQDPDVIITWKQLITIPDVVRDVRGTRLKPGFMWRMAVRNKLELDFHNALEDYLDRLGDIEPGKEYVFTHAVIARDPNKRSDF